MERRKLASILMMLGGGITIFFGMFHLFLPSLFDWATKLKGIESETKTILYLINTFLGISLLILGVLSILQAPGLKEGKKLAAFLGIGVGTFWALRAIAQPLVLGLGGGFLPLFLIFILTTLLYWFPIFAFWKELFVNKEVG